MRQIRDTSEPRAAADNYTLKKRDFFFFSHPKWRRSCVISNQILEQEINQSVLAGFFISEFPGFYLF